MSNTGSGVSPETSGVTLEIEREGKIVRVNWLGDITLAVVREGFSRTRQFAAGRELHGAISDLSNVRSFSLSSEDVYALTQEEPVFVTEIPHITVTGSDHIFGMVRMFELMSDGRSVGIHVVRTMKEAYSLLQLEEPAFHSVEPSGPAHH